MYAELYFLVNYIIKCVWLINQKIKIFDSRGCLELALKFYLKIFKHRIFILENLVIIFEK